MKSPSLLQRYRCYYTPQTAEGWVVPSESGVLPFIDVDATDAEHAMRQAHHAKSAPISEVVRLDGPKPRAVKAVRKARPVIKLITGAAMLAAIVGCGGGSDDDKASIQPPQCVGHPESCK